MVPFQNCVSAALKSTFGSFFCYSTPYSSTSWWHHALIWLGTTHPCNPPHYGLWVKLHFFTICMYKHCFLPVLLVFVMKCCIMMPCSSLCLKTIIAARFLHLYACLTCSSVHASILHPLLAHHHLCYCHVDVYCVFFYLHIFFLNCKYHVFLFSNHLVFFSFYNK